MSKISIIVPVYNVEKYIHRCVDSAINQTYQNLEIILVDDGSPDNCGKICDEYAQKDNRINVIHKENGGLSEARNFGIESSTGEWIFLLDSDDWIHQQTIENLYNAATENNVSVSLCSCSETSGEEPFVDLSIKPEILTPKDLRLKNQVAATIACAKLYKKDCFKNIRYPLGKLHEDEFVTYRILFAQEKIAFIDQPYYYYFINNEGITKKQWTPKRLDALVAVEEQLVFFETLGDNELIEVTESLMCWVLDTNYNHAKNLNFKKECRYLRRKVVAIVLKSPRKLFETKNIWVLESFFPHFMRCYWIVKKILNVIFRNK